MQTMLRMTEDQKVPYMSGEKKVRIRWMVQHDLDSVQQIEKECFEYQWSEEDFIKCLHRRNCIGLVAEYQGEIVGFMVYEFMKRRIHLLNLGIRQSVRRQQIGSQMMQRLIRKLQGSDRSRITFAVRERNLIAQLFFHKLGFVAVSILRDFYEESCEDAYLMQYRDTSSLNSKKHSCSKKHFMRHYN